MSTPTCPACGAKFAHDQRAQKCRKCGLPDEVRDAGGKEIARWKRTMRKRIVLDGIEPFPKENKSNDNRRRNKHGRKGVTDAQAHSARRPRYRRAGADRDS